MTINPGTEGGGLLTKIGDDCLLLVGAHVAHDCQIGNHVILVNHATLGGHCRIDDYAILGGLSAVHQFVRIGESGFVGGMSGVENDVIPFGSAIGNRAELGGLNIVGLTRRGFSREAIHQLRRAYRTLFGPEGTLKERLADVEEEFAERRQRAEDRRLHPRGRRPRHLHAAGAKRRRLIAHGRRCGNRRAERTRRARARSPSSPAAASCRRWSPRRRAGTGAGRSSSPSPARPSPTSFAPAPVHVVRWGEIGRLLPADRGERLPRGGA